MVDVYVFLVDFYVMMVMMKIIILIIVITISVIIRVNMSAVTNHELLTKGSSKQESKIACLAHDLLEDDISDGIIQPAMIIFAP